MIVWRLAEDRYARDLSGMGSRLAGGRWNAVGTPVLYTSSHLSLAALELLVHAPNLLGEGFLHKTAIAIDLPENMSVHTVNMLPSALKGKELLNWCQKAADQWINDGAAPLMRVPSVIVPEEFNIVINCAHAEMTRVRIVAERRFQFDKRLFG